MPRPFSPTVVSVDKNHSFPPLPLDPHSLPLTFQRRGRDRGGKSFRWGRSEFIACEATVAAENVKMHLSKQGMGSFNTLETRFYPFLLTRDTL